MTKTFLKLDRTSAKCLTEGHSSRAAIIIVTDNLAHASFIPYLVSWAQLVILTLDDWTLQDVAINVFKFFDFAYVRRDLFLIKHII